MPKHPSMRPSVSEALEDVLENSLHILAPLRETLPNWYDKISALLRAAAHERLRIGVVGVTSTGKSTFINGLLGEMLLPEQSKATTNLPVICRKGSERRLSIHYSEERVEILRGDEVTEAALRAFCSEDGNPGNAKDIQRLELETPKCCLPAELEIIDTPGTNAYGLLRHEEVTLRQCLSISDIAVFMTQIRRKFEKSEGRLLDAVIDGDQRVLFVISHADIEKDDYEGGRLIRDRHEKLKHHVENLRNDLKGFPALRECGIVAVSSQFAKGAAGNRASESWRKSNFETVLRFFEQFAGDLASTLAASRLERTRAHLAGLCAALGEQSPKLENDSQVTPQEELLADTVKRYAAMERDLRRRLEKLHDDVEEAIDAGKLQADMKAELAHVPGTDIGEFRNRVARLEGRWQTQTEALLRQLDAIRATGREKLSELGLTTGRRKVQERLLRLPSFPAVQGSIVRQQQSYTVEKPRTFPLIGGLIDAFFGMRTEQRTRTIESIDAVALKRALADFFAASAVAIVSFFEEESKTLANLYIDPIRDECEEKRRLLGDLRSARQRSASDLAKLPLMVEDLRELLERLPRSTKAVAPITVVHSAYAEEAAASASGRRPMAADALRPLLARIWENAAVAQFWRMANTVGSRGTGGIFLAMTDGASARRLLAFLTRSAVEDQGAVDATIQRNGAATRVFSLANERPETFRAACAAASAIAVPVEAARVSAAVKQLLEAPVFPILSEFPQKVFFVADEGAYFESHLHDLVTEVLPLVADATGFVGAPWFVFDAARYDARYSNFMELASQVQRAGGASRDLVRHWRDARLSMRPPFQEADLKNAFSWIVTQRVEGVK